MRDLWRQGAIRRDSVSEKDLTMPLYYEQNVEFSLRDKIKNIFNQLDLNSCSANAVSKQISIAAYLDYDVSRLFIYYNSRLVENEYNKRSISDDGCNLRGVMKALMNSQVHQCAAGSAVGFCWKSTIGCDLELFVDVHFCRRCDFMKYEV